MPQASDAKPTGTQVTDATSAFSPEAMHS